MVTGADHAAETGADATRTSDGRPDSLRTGNERLLQEHGPIAGNAARVEARVGIFPRQPE
jgi:hypothetical protein